MLVSRLLGLGAPVIVENGAALLVPDGHLNCGVPGGRWDGELHVLRLGPPRETLRAALVEVAAAARVEVRVPPAPEREDTEPFLVETEEDAGALARKAAARGLRVLRGEKLWHLCGGADKGLAVRMLLSLYEREGRLPRAVALGTWQVDLPMLRAAHRPVVLPGPGGDVEPWLAAELPDAERAPRGGAGGLERRRAGHPDRAPPSRPRPGRPARRRSPGQRRRSDLRVADLRPDPAASLLIRGRTGALSTGRR